MKFNILVRSTRGGFREDNTNDEAALGAYIAKLRDLGLVRMVAEFRNPRRTWVDYNLIFTQQDIEIKEEEKIKNERRLRRERVYYQGHLILETFESRDLEDNLIAFNWKHFDEHLPKQRIVEAAALPADENRGPGPIQGETLVKDLFTFVSALPANLSNLNKSKNGTKYQLLVNAATNILTLEGSTDEDDLRKKLAHIISVVLQHTSSSDANLTKSGEKVLSMLQNQYRYTLWAFMCAHDDQMRGREPSKENLELFVQRNTQRTINYSAANAKQCFDEKQAMPLFSATVNPGNDLGRIEAAILSAIQQRVPNLIIPVTENFNTRKLFAEVILAMQQAYAGLSESRNTQKDTDLKRDIRDYIDGLANDDDDLRARALSSFLTNVTKHKEKPFHFHKQPQSATIFFQSLSPEAKNFVI